MNPNFFNFSKQKKRNLLSELLIGKSTEGIVSKKELNALNKLIQETSPKPVPVKTNNLSPERKKVPAARKKPQNKKIKTTYYLSEKIFDDLGMTHMTIRSLVPEHVRSRVSKSYIVNQAIAMILQEFSAKGKKSRLVRNIMQNT
jgi:hypothetical protein